MKKIFALLLTTLMFAVPVCAAVDLSTMTDDEIIALRDSVDAEVIARGLKEVIPAGVYVVGKDMVANRYTFTGQEEESFSYLAYYNSKDDYDNGDIEANTLLGYGEPFFLSLEDGMVLEIRNNMWIEWPKGSFLVQQ